MIEENRNKANLDVLLDMLNHSDPNLSYFAATRIPTIMVLLESTQEHTLIAKLINKLCELRKSCKLDD
jgi:hypothetical protein